MKAREGSRVLPKVLERPDGLAPPKVVSHCRAGPGKAQCLPQYCDLIDKLVFVLGLTESGDLRALGWPLARLGLND